MCTVDVVLPELTCLGVCVCMYVFVYIYICLCKCEVGKCSHTEHTGTVCEHNLSACVRLCLRFLQACPILNCMYTVYCILNKNIEWIKHLLSLVLRHCSSSIHQSLWIDVCYLGCSFFNPQISPLISIFLLWPIPIIPVPIQVDVVFHIIILIFTRKMNLNALSVEASCGKIALSCNSVRTKQ